MACVLVDTSVWVQHFKHGEAQLVELLHRDAVLTHPLVIGEILCGTPPERKTILTHLLNLKQASRPCLREIIEFVERHQLYGCGCGFVDLSLPASALMTPAATLWTRDKRLARLAVNFGVAYRPAPT